MNKVSCKTITEEPLFALPPRKPLLIVLSGPSGVGKDAVLARMKRLGHPFEHVITVTTRPRRATEKDNVDYHFVAPEKFQEMVQHGELLEWAVVYGNWYGVPKEAIRQVLSRGQDVVIKIDVQGAATIKRLVPQAVFIFLMPPSLEELICRLRQRSTESSFDLALRIEIAEEEVRQLPLFDYVVVNEPGKIDQAAFEIKAIIIAEKCRVTAREINI